jgi:hypothetical protein
MYDVLNELDCFGCTVFYEQFILDPLGEFINDHKVVFETTLGFLERSYLIQPLAGERPSRQDTDKIVC